MQVDPNKKEAQTLVPIEAVTLGGAFRVRLGNAPDTDSQQDAAILAFEYERRRTAWWKWRRFGLIGLPSLIVLFLIISFMGLILGWLWSGFLVPLSFVLLAVWLGFALYCYLTLPRVVSFGRAYRRFMSVPLQRNGIVWADSAIIPPDFRAFRTSFFTLYKDSHHMGTHVQPVDNAQETERKKQTLLDLKALLNPSSVTPPEVETPFLPRQDTLVFDRLSLEALSWDETAALSAHSLPLGMQHLNTPFEMQRLAHDIESYTYMRAEITEALPLPTETPLHRQMTTSVGENFSQVGAELERWRTRTAKEKTFFAGVVTRYKEAENAVRLHYERTILRLEEEIQPALAQLDSDAAFYEKQLDDFYSAQRTVIEGQRNEVLSKLDRERGQLENVLDERLDEQALVQAEFKGLSEQRVRLENSTDKRFASLRTQLSDLVRRTYTLPAIPYFHSDHQELASANSSEECLQQLAELRAETRLATSTVSNSLNRFAKLHFEPLDELARLESQIAASDKWQATTHLANLINFKQSGQLLALAGEVSESASIYLESVNDFERLNRRWCALEVSIRTLGLTSYTNRLQEAQEYLVALAQATASLHSSLMIAPHSPEMARPTTFQNIYDQAAGLQRELEELGSLAGLITQAETQVMTVSEQLGNIRTDLDKNRTETERIEADASSKLYEIAQKLEYLFDKLDELKSNRINRIRAHIDTLSDEKEFMIGAFRNGASELGNVGIVADKLLRKHIIRAERLLDDARHRHRDLEGTIADIVEDFEDSVLLDRSLAAPTELYIPVWFFQFKERPLWTPRVVGFASCYIGFEHPKNTLSKERASLWSYLISLKPNTFYRLRENEELANLIGAHLLEYPANQVAANHEGLDRLAAEGWLNRWLVKTLRLSLKSR